MSGVDNARGGFVELKKGYAGMYTITNVTCIIPTTEGGVDGDEVLCGEDSKINSVPIFTRNVPR
jgi:hypothetical protein